MANKRCAWAKNDLAIIYHDTEWGVPLHDDRKWFEFLILDAAQAGLSWDIILKKREGYRRAFDDFDAQKVSRYGKQKIQALLNDSGIIRNRLKIEFAVTNARSFLSVQEEFGSFDDYIWQFVGGKPIKNAHRVTSDVPTQSNESDAMSKDLNMPALNNAPCLYARWGMRMLPRASAGSLLRVTTPMKHCMGHYQAQSIFV